MSGHNLLAELKKIDVLDLPYVERDLNFAQKVSLSFLLYGDEHSSATYILQKLLVLARATDWRHSDILSQYAKYKPQSWHQNLVEALCIIGARQVLRKLGLRWQELRMHYLPHIGGISLHIHPLLKSLYTICEELTLAQSAHMVLDIRDKVRAGDPLRYYNSAHLEIFMLDWMTRRLIRLGDINANGSDVQLLIEYFKLNDLCAQATLLVDTVNSNATSILAHAPTSVSPNRETSDSAKPNVLPTVVYSGLANESSSSTASSSRQRAQNAIQLSRENAGIALIINQQKFHRDVNDDLKIYLPPVALPPRHGTDVDKQRLTDVFSALGYKVQAHDNLTHFSMLHHIRQACELSLLHDSVVVCILSHGFGEAVYGSNSIALRISDIENVLCSYENLYNKPKLAIIQACQQEDKNNNALPYKIHASTKSPDQHLNMLRAMSTVPGFAAMRHTHTGSWFIQCLCDAIVEHADSDHIADILTIVINNVANKRGNKNETMVPWIGGALRQHVYFPSAIATDSRVPKDKN
ncbi:caspase-8 isoform X2 [Drosophila obscura]|uniref:caspase-8 isoform X2 n=1 Tax=Drosophila obscura TaxID=7282 RepID=UPI001BB0EC5F|nr:caspase-8 isoform X2 [Drosophila obscura]